MTGCEIPSDSATSSNNSSASNTITPGGLESNKFTDTRDGQVYKYVKIGTQTWMAQNLNYKVDSSWCPDNDPTYCNAKYGRIYQWAAAMAIDTSYNHKLWKGADSMQHQGICPEGWHIPSDLDWSVLIAYIGIDSAGTRLKSTYGWHDTLGNSAGNGTDQYAFNVLPAGYRNIVGSFYNSGNNGTFNYIGSKAYFWSSTQHGTTSYAWGRYFFYDDTYADRSSGYGFKPNGFSLRCIQN